MSKAQRDENRYAVMSYVPLELVARLKSYIEGREVPNKLRKGQTVRKPTRPMGMSDALIGFAEKALAKQEVLPKYRRWADRTLRHNIAERKVTDREYADAVKRRKNFNER